MKDVMRVEFSQISNEVKEVVKGIKVRGNELHEILENFENADERMMALAKTNLEQAIMWAVKALT